MLTKVHIVKVMVFPVVLYGCKSCTIKKAEYKRIHAFELWCWIRFLRVSWTARRSNKSIQKEINPKYSLEWLMLKLKLQYLRYLMWRADSLEKTPMMGKTEGQRRGRWQRMRRLDNITDSMHVNLSKLWEIVEDRGAWPAAVHGVAKNQTRLSRWTKTMSMVHFCALCSFLLIHVSVFVYDTILVWLVCAHTILLWLYYCSFVV